MRLVQIAKNVQKCTRHLKLHWNQDTKILDNNSPGGHFPIEKGKINEGEPKSQRGGRGYNSRDCILIIFSYIYLLHFDAKSGGL